MEVPSRASFLAMDEVDGSYRGLPSLYLGLLAVWSISTCYLGVNTWRNRHFQLNNLRWILGSAPHSCYNLETCSLWMSFGVYVSGIFYQTTTFVCFLLISHGYCIMCEQLSINEQRRTATLACFLYFTLVGYRADVPYSTVFMLLCYFLAFYMIFCHISQNLVALREQLSSSYPDGSIHGMHDAMHTKFTVYKKFQGAMQIVAVIEVAIVAREWTQFCIFMYIGWIFRPQEISPLFSVMRMVKSRGVRVPLPVYRVEIDAADFRDLASQSLQVGVVSSQSPFPRRPAGSIDQLLVVVQHPVCRKAAAS
ncbi:unnamed protein product [Spirodela intermedia]|uniref:Uncharacterized protein n=1 Tax=Spirodela intermedia TaxID=51605 RepID=A0A7I8J7H5_SPIIN|nr:unnamed protein product [Spirodela intermedia]CAA6666024.1 unnamed protein product [Spirodela intermedia]